MDQPSVSFTYNKTYKKLPFDSMFPIISNKFNEKVIIWSFYTEDGKQQQKPAAIIII